jgi:glycosyltransferase involved in cell wall biosynthesis
LRRATLFEHNIPSKLYEIMASSRPVVIGTRGESRSLVKSAGCGVAVEPESATHVAEAIRHFYECPDVGHQMGCRGRQYVTTHNDRAVLADRYTKVLVDLCRESS